MKLIFTNLILFLALGLFSQVNRTFVQTFAAGAADVVHIVLPGTIEVTRWSNSTIRVLAEIELPGRNDAMLRALVQSGRYQLRYEVTGTAARLGSAMLENPAIINGHTLREKITFRIMIPEWMDVLPKIEQEDGDSEIIFYVQ